MRVTKWFKDMSAPQGEPVLPFIVSSLPPGNEVWSKVMLPQVFVCPRGRGRMHHRSHDWRGLHPVGSASWEVCIQRVGKTPGSAYTGSASREELHPEGLGRPLHRDTWDTAGYGLPSERYTPYWNAFLLFLMFYC